MSLIRLLSRAVKACSSKLTAAPRPYTAWGWLLVFYMASRLYGLTNMPVFIDEAVHIDWTRRTLQGDLGVGIQVSKWLPIKIMAMVAALPVDSLLAVRLASVMVGLATLTACVFLARTLYSTQTGYIAAVLLTITPFVLFYDRLALADNYVMAFGSWMLLLSVRLARTPRTLEAVLLVLSTIAAMLSKLTVIFLLPLPILAVLILSPTRLRTVALRYTLGSTTAGVALFVWLLSIGAGTELAASQASTPAVHSLAGTILANLALTADWFWLLLTPPLFILMCIGAVALRVQHERRSHLVLVLAIMTVVIPYILLAKEWFPRYVLIAVVPAIVLSAAWLSKLIEHRTRYVRYTAWQWSLLLVALALSIWPISTDVLMLVDTPAAPLPHIEREQYVSGWSAGYGLPELASFFSTRVLTEPAGINILRFKFWSPPRQGLDVYLSPSPAIQLYILDPENPTTRELIANLTRQRRTFLVLNPPVEARLLRNINQSLEDYIGVGSRIWRMSRPGSVYGLEVWELAP